MLTVARAQLHRGNDPCFRAQPDAADRGIEFPAITLRLRLDPGVGLDPVADDWIPKKDTNFVMRALLHQTTSLDVLAPDYPDGSLCTLLRALRTFPRLRNVWLDLSGWTPASDAPASDAPADDASTDPAELCYRALQSNLYDIAAPGEPKKTTEPMRRAKLQRLWLNLSGTRWRSPNHLTTALVTLIRDHVEGVLVVQVAPDPTFEEAATTSWFTELCKDLNAATPGRCVYLVRPDRPTNITQCSAWLTHLSTVGACEAKLGWYRPPPTMTDG